MCSHELLNDNLTNVIDEVADFIWVGWAGPVLVLRSCHEVWHHVVPEHFGPVVQTTVENTQIIVLMENTCRGSHRRHCISQAKTIRHLFVHFYNKYKSMFLEMPFAWNKN